MKKNIEYQTWVNENIAGNYAIINFKVVLLENGVIRRGHMENNLNNFYNKQQLSDTFPADFSWRNVLAKPCILLFTLQQDCNTREA